MLVVIGILIALQINTWNKERVGKAQEIQLYQKILEDLEQAQEIVRDELNAFKIYQRMHMQLYRESKGEASFDPSIKYQELRWIGNYNSIVTDNHSESVSLISNEHARSGLNDYLKVEQQTIKAYLIYEKVKTEKMIPFIVKNGIMDSEVIFENVDHDWINILDEEIESTNYNNLKRQYGSVEFDQILTLTYLRTGYVIHNLDNQKNQIDLLKALLEKEIESYKPLF